MIFTAPAGYTATTYPGGITRPVTLTAGENNTTLDAGFVVNSPVFVLLKAVNTATAKLGDVLTYTLTLINTNVVSGSAVVSDVLDGSVAYVPGSVSTSIGTYNTSTGFWTISSLPGNATATLTFSVSVTGEGLIYNQATIGTQTAKACTSVPTRVCAGTSYAFSLSVAAGKNCYQWYKNDVLIQDNLATGGPTAYTAATAGAYRVVVNEGVASKCADVSCCPFVIGEVSLPELSLIPAAPTYEGATPRTDGKIVVTSATSPTALAGLTYQLSTTGFNSLTATTIQPVAVPANGEIIGNGIGGMAYYCRYSARHWAMANRVRLICRWLCR